MQKIRILLSVCYPRIQILAMQEKYILQSQKPHFSYMDLYEAETTKKVCKFVFGAQGVFYRKLLEKRRLPITLAILSTCI